MNRIMTSERVVEMFREDHLRKVEHEIRNHVLYGFSCGYNYVLEAAERAFGGYYTEEYQKIVNMLEEMEKPKRVDYSVDEHHCSVTACYRFPELKVGSKECIACPFFSEIENGFVLCDFKKEGE